MTEQQERDYRNWLAADAAWQAELVRTYGARAQDARYDYALQTATPELARLKAEFDRCADARRASDYTRADVERICDELAAMED